jgi:hypothetical protein
MEELTTGGIGQGRRGFLSFLRSDGFQLSLLLALATFIRVWHLYHTEVTARDSIGFQRYAWELRHKDWKQALRDNAHHPLYPLTILAMSELVGSLRPGSDLEVMQLSAQLAGGLAGILLVIPMFYLGRELFDRRVGFWATGLFQCLPAGARVLSDALSEPLFLLLSVTGLLMAVRALRSGSSVGFALCGFFTGLAYLTRPEGVLLAVSVGLVLLAFGRARRVCRHTLPSRGTQTARRRTPAYPPRPPQTWQRTLTQLICLSLPVLMLSGPYVAVIGGFSNKTNAKEILNSARYDSHPEEESKQRGPSNRGLLFASLVASWWPDRTEGDFTSLLGWSLGALTGEIGKGFFYVAWIPALSGLFWFRERLRVIPGSWVLLVLCLLQSLALLRVAMSAGYVSERHVLIVVLCGLYWAVAMVLYLGETTTGDTGKRNGETAKRQNGERRSTIPCLVDSPVLSFSVLSVFPVVLLLGFGLLGLIKTLAPLHANRAGHHAMGLWLAEHAGPADEIVDPFCWAAHYAGRTFLSPNSAPVGPSLCRHRFIVHECRPDHREKYRPPSIPEADILAAGGVVVYHWPSNTSLGEAKILLYDIPMNLDAKGP